MRVWHSPDQDRQFRASDRLSRHNSSHDTLPTDEDLASLVGSMLHTATIGFLSASERSNTTELWPVATSAVVPFAATRAEVTITALRSSSSNDGYADNISLILLQE